MPALAVATIRSLLAPFYPAVDEVVAGRLGQYLDLLLKWNERTNLTAIRSPEEIVRRHFGESLFVARHLPPAATLLDLGSGAGFPGIPVQLALPALRVTLAESQHKKSAFLREAVRVLGLQAEVWAGRVEEMPRERQFEVVAMRAVDRPLEALRLAVARVSPEGCIALLTTAIEDRAGDILLPGSDRRVLRLLRAEDLPRGT
jgi:16S rRNA (guanine527-N7)-methyltransferase